MTTFSKTALSASAATILWLLVPWLFHVSNGSDWVISAGVGSLFGVVGALFSALAMVFAATAVYLQHKDLTLSRRASHVQTELAVLPQILADADRRLSIFQETLGWAMSLDNTSLVEELKKRKTTFLSLRESSEKHSIQLEKQLGFPTGSKEDKELRDKLQVSMSEFADYDYKYKQTAEALEIAIDKGILLKRLTLIYTQALQQSAKNI